MKRVFDAHMHLNLQADNVADDFIEQVGMNKLSGVGLILNTEDEQTALCAGYERYVELSASIPFVVSLGLSLSAYKDVKLLQNIKEQFQTAVKIHPRMHRYTINDYSAISDVVQHINAGIIVIDAFFNGHNLENHIGIDLAILLATDFPKKRIVIAHIGGHRALDCIMSTKTLDNVYHDVSFSINFFEDTSAAQDIAFCCKKYNKRIMFGSDYPYYAVKDSIECMERYFSKYGLTEAEQDNIMFNNAMYVYCEEKPEND